MHSRRRSGHGGPVTTMRIASADLQDVEETDPVENTGPEDRPSLDERTTLLQLQTVPGRTDTATVREVHDWKRPGWPWSLLPPRRDRASAPGACRRTTADAAPPGRRPVARRSTAWSR
jgi:hypothetical protein